MTVTGTPVEPASAPLSAPRPRRRWWLAIRVSLSVGLVAALMVWADLGQLWRVLGGVSVAGLAALLAMFSAERVVAAYRWHLLLRAQGGEMGFAITFKATLLGGFLGGFLPGIVGHEAVRMLAMARATGRAAVAVSSVIFDRLIGTLALLAMVIVALAFVGPGQVARSVDALAYGGAAATLLILAAMMHGRGRTWIADRARARPGSRLIRELEAFADAGHALAGRAGVLAQVAAWAVIFQALRVGIAPVAAWALGIDVPLVYCLIYVPIIILLMMLPVSIAGLGVREVGFVYFFGATLMSHEQALAIGLLIAVLTLLFQMPGAVVCITGVGTARPASPG